jgi:tyrocidine synthetase-3
MFVNTLALRNYPGAGKTVSEFLGEVKMRSLEAFENQDYSLDSLVAKIDGLRDVQQLGFGFEKRENVVGEKSELNLKPYPFRNKTSKADLSLFGLETDRHIILEISYAARRYTGETIKRFITYFKTILSQILEDPGKKLDDIEALGDEEKRSLMKKIRDDKYKRMETEQNTAKKLEAGFDF